MTGIKRHGRFPVPWLITLSAAAFAWTGPLQAATVYVATTGSDVNDGQSWPTAKGTVQGGLNTAVSGDQVWVAAGLYIERITLKSGVDLYGGFVGTETDLAQRDWALYHTILDGNQAGTVVTSPSGTTQTTRIDGFTIRNGSGTLLSNSHYGGGIYCNSSSPTISNNTIAGNGADYGGGGIYCDQSSPTISNNTITGNSAKYGGGIFCIFSSPPISNNTITSNSGGGIYCTGQGSPAISNNTIIANGARYGGGICSVSSSPAISNNIVAFNSSGLFRSGGTPTLSNNCLYNPGGADYSGLNPGTGDIAVDPQLLAADEGQIHVKAGSLCIDAGDDAPVQPSSLDMDGQPRTQGAHVDIGADEFDGTTPPFTLKIIRVSPAGNDANDGSTWASAKLTVQIAIDAAAGAGGEVWVAAGVYSERITLQMWVHTYGGFAGTESSRDQRQWITNPTILDGGRAGSVVTASAPGYRSSTINGFTIRNGSGTGSNGYTSGAGIYCHSSSPVISNNSITGNRANSVGGGIYCLDSSPVISNNTITANSAVYGGGIDCWGYAFPAISNNTITGNSAVYGGGIHCSQVTSPAITNNLVAFNSSGLENSGGKPTLRNNCVYNPGGIDYLGLSAGAGDISVDPQLVAAEYGEAHLKAGSPCIDAGLDPVVRSDWVDMDGQARIQGAHVDIGADESDGTTPPFTLKNTRVSPGGSDANDGSSWASAKLTVQAAIDAAAGVGGGEVWVAAGVYSERITLPMWVHAYGGFAGTENSRDQRQWITNPTILDGGRGGSVVTASAPGYRSSTINGFTIRNGGPPTSNGYRWPGGGIYCDASSPAICNNTITSNMASDGGGIYCTNASSPPISNNTIIGNSAYSGGGIYCSYSSASISNNTVSRNGADYDGGGFYSVNSSLVISNNTITGNRADSGGGIYYSASSAVISNNVVAFNSSGLFRSSGTPTLSNNCVYNPGGANYSGLSPGTGDISVDPQLLAADEGEVHLKAGSPCIDAGDNATVQTGWMDMDGEARIQGPHVDIGADEFNGTTPPFVLKIFRVSPSGSDANDGSTWASAKRTVQAAIDAAAGAGGGEVWVAAGLYSERITLKMCVHVFGGFAGTESSREQRDWLTSPTILDGGPNGTVVTASSPGYRSSTIDGFTIRKGGDKGIDVGGGIYCRFSSPAISNNTITGNSGGGIYCSYSSAAISGNRISGNSATYGGGIQCSYSSPTISNNIITANRAIRGGGVSWDSLSPIISNNTITGNSAEFGGGMYCRSSSPVISNNIVAFNSSGLYLYDPGAPLTLRNNCVYNPDGDNYFGLHPGTGDISADPQLLSADEGEVHLKAGSPCIDAGLDAVVQTGWLDVDDQPRIQGAHVDIGADEFNGTTPPFALKIVRVSPTGNDAYDGSSWASAKLKVQGAIDAAMGAGGGEVWVAGGLYNERITLKSWVHVYGGFAGTESGRDQRRWVTNPTILDGGAGGTVVTSSSPGYRSSTIDGFTIRNGGHNTSGFGGGIYCNSSSPTISNNTITRNRAVNGGGGIYCFHCSPMISGNRISGNSTTYDAGGIYCSDSTPAISNNTITGNSGGGISFDNCPSASISNNIVAFNSFGLYNSNGTPTLRSNCVYNPAGTNYFGLGAGTGDISVDPLLVNWQAGDFHFAPGSPCIDAGYNAGVPAGVLTDLDGHLRVLDDPATPDCQWSPGNCGTAPIVDMGAYEFIPVIPGDFDRDGDVDQSDFGGFQACLTGPGFPQNDAGCSAARLDADDDVDEGDFSIFQRCLSGPNVPANPACAN